MGLECKPAIGLLRRKLSKETKSALKKYIMTIKYVLSQDFYNF